MPFRDFAESFFGQFPPLRGRVPVNQEPAVLSGYVGEVRKGTLGAGALGALGGGLAQLPIHFARLLRLLFVEDVGGDVVTLEHFGKCLEWVGPVESDDPHAFFFRIARLYARPWFFGGLRTADATSQLLTRPPGTFLVRRLGFFLFLLTRCRCAFATLPSTMDSTFCRR